jgi:endonuclease YncB( thermonuclease family)
MNRGILNASLSLPAIIGAFVLATSAHATTNAVIDGKCVGVHDGDTITVLVATNSQVKVRLAGIDAPELGQAFGQRAKQALSERVFGKDVRIVVVDTDRYGRTVGDVNVGTNWINKAMVEAGMAWHYVVYTKDKELAAAEETARRNRRGLWADKVPAPPWEWRKTEKERSE